MDIGGFGLPQGGGIMGPTQGGIVQNPSRVPNMQSHMMPGGGGMVDPTRTSKTGFCLFV